MAKETHEYQREIIALRTWLFYNAAVTYVFTDLNTWITLGVTFGLELLFSLFVYIYIYNLNYFTRPKFFWIDFTVALIFAVIAPFELATFEYVFDGVAFIGDSKTWALVGLLIAINALRTLLLFVSKQSVLISILVIALIPIFITFLVLITNQSFYADGHSISVILNFVWITLLTCTIMTFILNACKASSYFAYLIHFIILFIILSVFWKHHSDRSFTYYL